MQYFKALVKKTHTRNLSPFYDQQRLQEEDNANDSERTEGQTETTRHPGKGDLSKKRHPKSAPHLSD